MLALTIALIQWVAGNVSLQKKRVKKLAITSGLKCVDPGLKITAVYKFNLLPLQRLLQTTG